MAGRPAYQPNDADRKMVTALAGFGITHEDICLKVLGPNGKPISPKTLRKHYAHELATGSITATAAVANNLFRMATGRGREAATCAIFWMKARARWRTAERGDEEDAAAGNGGLTVNIVRFTAPPDAIDVTPRQPSLAAPVTIRRFTDAAAK